VTFNGNDANSGTMNPEIANSLSTLSANAFVNTGFSFAGWNTLVNGTDPVSRRRFLFAASSVLRPE